MAQGGRAWQTTVSDVSWTTTAPDGTVYKYKNGLLHCEHGPAVTRPDGSREYWLFGLQTLLVPASPVNR